MINSGQVKDVNCIACGLNKSDGLLFNILFDSGHYCFTTSREVVIQAKSHSILPGDTIMFHDLGSCVVHCRPPRHGKGFDYLLKKVGKV